MTVPEVTVSALLNRMKTEPWGVLGGGDGAVGGLWVRRAGDDGLADVRRGVRDDVAVEVLRRDAPRGRPGEDPDAGRRRLRRPGAARPRARCAATSRKASSARRRRATVYGLEDGSADVGEWKQSEISYLKANRAACALCGHPIASATGAPRSTASPQKFCSPEHERLYHDYWLPRYGAKEVS